MKTRAQLPQQLSVDQLSQHEEEDKELWAPIFPLRNGKRLAGLFRAEVYSRGASAESYVREYLRAKEASGSVAGREVIATLSALDTMLIHEQAKGVLNKPSTVKSARNGYALVRLFRDVRKESDWQRPNGTEGSGWKRKMDWEIARRRDPF